MLFFLERGLMTSQVLELQAWNTMLASMAYLSTAVQRIRSSHSFCRGTVNVYVRAEKTCPGWCLGTKGI